MRCVVIASCQTPMTVAAIVQARYGSTRLPGKVLLPLNEHLVLDEVLARCKIIPGIDVVCCAVSESIDANPVAAAAEAQGVNVTRGSETNVLRRYADAARSVDADIVLRVTSDCPLIAPEICADLIALRAKTGAHFVSNNDPPSFPLGLDCEVFTSQLLYEADEKATASDEREHVSPWMRRRSQVHRAALRGPGKPASSQRWVLDRPDDYDFLQAVFAQLPKASAILPWRKVYAMVTSDPKLRGFHHAKSRA
jgi:spore coat polysaccharide biosynthesis protein SpsF